MRGPLAWPLLLVARRGPAARTWKPSGPAWATTARAWTLAPRAPGTLLAWTGLRPGLPGGVSLARAVVRWAGSPASRRYAALAGPGPPRAGLQGAPAAAARTRAEVGRRALAADPEDDRRARPAAGRSEARKLLALVRPERGRLAGKGGSSGGGDRWQVSS